MATPAQDPAIELVPVTDSIEGAFTVDLPRGWTVDARSLRPGGVHRPVAMARSPEGDTQIFIGDPQLPDYLEPYSGMMPHPMAVLMPFQPAEAFFRGYAHNRYGAAPGFRITACARNPALEQPLIEGAQRRGIPARASGASLSFELQDGPRRVRGRLHGTTSGPPPLWVAVVFGALTTIDMDPARWDALLLRIFGSLRFDPRWQQLRDQTHAQRMVQIQQDDQAARAAMQIRHQGNMAWIQNSTAAHAQRMDNLHASADAQLAGWRAREDAGDQAHQAFLSGLRGESPAAPMAAPGGDFGHRRFLNVITEQETVIDGAGNAYQVEGGHERYYKHRRDNSYLGTDASVEHQDLRARFGVNPDDYEEVRIKR